MAIKVEFLGHFGDDKSVADNARVSFDSSADDYSEEQNENLTKFLAYGMTTKEHNGFIETVSVASKEEIGKLLRKYRKTPTHWVPFAHTFLKFGVSAPVPIRTQCFKHKIGLSESEVSRRYVSSRPEVYVPDAFRMKAENVKQGSYGTHPENLALREEYKKSTNAAVELYLDFIARGVCPEQARFLLPQGAEVKWIWSGNLYAFANFYIARSDSHAQKEVQEIANQVDKLVRPLFPLAWAYLVD